MCYQNATLNCFLQTSKMTMKLKQAMDAAGLGTWDYKLLSGVDPE
jgi:hypothetical protein